MINVFGAIKLARTMAQKSGLTICLEDEARPRTDGRVLYLQRPDDTWGSEEWIEWWGLFYHETGHNDPDMRDIFALVNEKNVDMDSFFGAGINIIDDHRQEHHRIHEYYGRRMALSQCHAQIVRKMLDREVFGKAGIDVEREATEALIAFDTYCRERWMPTVAGMTEEICRQLTTQSNQWYQQLTDRYSEFDLKNVATAEDEYQLWKKIITEIFGFDASQKEQEGTGKSKKSAEEGEGEEGEGGKKEGSGEGEGEGDEESASERDRKAKYDDILKHKHSNKQEHSSYSPLHIQYGAPTYGEWKLKDPKVVEYRTTTPQDNPKYRNLIGAMQHSGKGLAGTVRRLLQIRSKAKRVYGQKKGKVSARNLHRLNVPDAKDYSERVFTQKHENTLLDTAVCVLGDSSGSMGGEKFAHMAQAAIMLNEAIGLIRVPMELLTFADSGGQNRIGVLKSYNERVGRDQLVNRFCDVSQHMGGNADGEAIMFAYSRLISQKNKRKILIVLSDGSPASSRGDADSHTRRVVNQIQREGKIEIYGIGIMDDNVKRIYKDHDVINSAQELEGALLTVIKTKILG
jgi:cobalamin biosynthesis protein CobT